MKSISKLTDFYYKTLYPSLKELDEERKKIKKRIISIAFLYAIFVIFVLSSLFASHISLDILIFVVAFSIAVGAFFYKYLIKDYTFDFKIKIIEPLIKEIDENLRYSSTLHIPERHFIRSELFSERVDRFSGNDYVRGRIDSIPIEFSDIHAEKKHKDSKGNTSWSTIFQGLFIVSEFNKNFNGTTIVLPDTAQKAFGDLVGNWLQSKNFTRGELVKMDDVSFEKEFVVYSDDQIEARYILSPSLMQKLLNFKKRSKYPLFISFKANNIHMAINYDKDLFEPSVFHSLLEYKVAMEYIETLHLVIGIVEELKLNEKLWSKL